MKQSLLFSLGIVLLLSVVAAGAAILIGAGPVELNSDEYVNITPTNSTETYEVPQATVLGALDAASIRGAFEYEVALDLSPEEGNLSILSIDGVENEVLNETPHAWTFRVNDEVATTGPAVTGVADGDEIVFSYGPPDHSVENASYTLNVFASVSGAAENVTPTPDENVTPTTPAENVTPVAEVSVNITAPEEGADVAAGNVTVSVDVTNFTLVEPTGQENAPGEGHLHYYLDALIPTDENEPAIPATGGYVISTNTSYTWEGVTSGEHNFSVQLVNNDHTPIIPLAADLVNVTVSEEVAPTPDENVTPVAEASVNITAPEEGADVAAGNVTVSVDVTNFTLVEPTGQENAPGEGHLHYYLDALIPTDENEPAIPETGGYIISTNTSYTWEGVTSGEHNFSVQLVNNDHTPIIPLAADLVNVTVSEEVAPTPDENVTPTPTEEVTPTPTEEVTPTPTEEVTPTPTEEVPAANVADEIVAGLSGEGDLTTFADAVNRSAVFQALDVNGTYVVCAPTDEAFSDLDNETFSMFQNDTEFQDSVLRYHIIEGDYTLEELVMMCQDATDGQITLPTVEGADVNVSLSEGGEVVINNAHAVAQIQITNNIVIYVINAVLIPPGIPTPTPTPTEEVTPTPTEEVTPTPTEEVTPTPTEEVTPTPTEEVTPTPTEEVTPTPTEEVTPTPTEEVTPTPTEEVTPTPTEEVTPTPTEEVTPTPTEEVTPTPTEEVTPTPTEEVTPTPTEEVTPAPPAEGIDIQLYDGWNFVSIPRPLAEGNNTAIAVFGDVDTAGRALYTHAPETGFEPLGADTTLEVLDGYWVYSNGTATVRLTFSTDPVRTPAAKTLSPGWNAIGYSDLTPSTANETFASVEDSWVYALGYDAENQGYRPALINNQLGPQGEDQDLLPAEGYWLFMRTDGTLAAISA